MYRLARIFQRFLLGLPRSAIILLGVLIGTFLYANQKKRRIAFRNVKLAFPAFSDARLRRIVRASFINFGIAILESFIPERIYPFVTIDIKEPFAPDGGILVGIHEGSWEVYNWSLAHQYNYAIFVRPQRNAAMDAFLNDVRRKENIKVSFSLKDLLRHLNNGYLIGLGVDHGAEDNAPMIEFFSHLVPTPRGAVYLAKKFNRKIYPGFGWRTTGLAHTLQIGDPINPANKSEEELLHELNRVYENFLREHPIEYLWWYKRFKRKTTVDAIVISDGKKGHEKQSDAFVAVLSQIKPHVRTRTLQVRYRNAITRFIAQLCAFFSSTSCVGCGRCLWLLLTPSSREELQKYYADIVISTGSYSAAINRIFSVYLGAKSVAILRPNIPLSRFDVTVIPEHDRIRAANTTLIKGALFYPTGLEDKIKLCRDFFNLSEEPKISVFFGGPLSNPDSFIANAKLFVDKIEEFARERRYKILVSTSRRTPQELEKYLEVHVEKNPLFEAVIYARRGSHDFVFEGFVSLSHTIFVTAESISMISETLSLQKPCVGVFLERIDDKHKVFLESMRAEISFLAPPFPLNTITHKPSRVFQDNIAALKEAIRCRL